MVNASTNEWLAVWGILGVAILGLLYAVFLTRQILAEDTGTPQMREISEAIRQGAVAYLSKQLRTIIISQLPSLAARRSSPNCRPMSPTPALAPCKSLWAAPALS
jgi:hypothetical protein